MSAPTRIQAIAESVFGPASPHHRELIAAGYHLVPDIPERKLVGACEAYATLDFRAEIPLLLMDDTVFGSGKRGFVITTAALYFNLTNPLDGFSDLKGRLALAAIRELRIIGDAIWVAGQKVGSFHHPPPGVVLALERFFAEAGVGAEPPEAPAAPIAEPGAARAAAREEVLETLRRLKELADDGVLTDEEFAQKKRELLARL